MAEKLRFLFEYQRFAPNARLAEMISAAEQGLAPLSDDQLYMVAAAGAAELCGEETCKAVFGEDEQQK